MIFRPTNITLDLCSDLPPWIDLGFSRLELFAGMMCFWRTRCDGESVNRAVHLSFDLRVPKLEVDERYMLHHFMFIF